MKYKLLILLLITYMCIDCKVSDVCIAVPVRQSVFSIIRMVLSGQRTKLHFVTLDGKECS